MDILDGVSGLLPMVGHWIRDTSMLTTGRQITLNCRPESSYFLRDREHRTGLVVLDLVLENHIHRPLWVKRLQLAALVDHAWVACERWPGETYAASWATGWRICKAEDRIDTKILKHLSLEPKLTAWGYTIHRIGDAIPDSASLTCRLALTPSQGKTVTTTIDVLRHINERQRADVKILQSVDIGLNRLYFHYDESNGDTITIPRFVYDAIVNSTKQPHVQLVRHWELTDSE